MSLAIKPEYLPFVKFNSKKLFSTEATFVHGEMKVKISSDLILTMKPLKAQTPASEGIGKITFDNTGKFVSFVANAPVVQANVLTPKPATSLKIPGSGGSNLIKSNRF